MAVATVARYDRGGSTTTTKMLLVILPGVESWQRPQPSRGKARYPAKYAQLRETWALHVRMACYDTGWKAVEGRRYGVTIAIRGGGKHDIDRVTTAVFDALQGGGALVDDCMVDCLEVKRVRQAAPVETAVMVRIL